MATFAAKASQLGEWSRDAQLNTDRNLRLQYLAGMSLNNDKAGEILAGILKYYRFPEDTFVGFSCEPANVKGGSARGGPKGWQHYHPKI